MLAPSNEEFSADFAVSEWRDTTERAMRISLNEEKKDCDACDFLLHVMKPFTPAGSILLSQVADKSPLKSELALTNFGMKQGSYHVSMEKYGLWTSRLVTTGRRSIAIFKATDIKQHMKSDGIIGKDVKVWLKELTVAGAAFRWQAVHGN